jgi:predicted Zn-dependent protease
LTIRCWANASTVSPGRIVMILTRKGLANLDHPVERFRLLNGLGPNDSVKPGERVKIVVE